MQPAARTSGAARAASESNEFKAPPNGFPKLFGAGYVATQPLTLYMRRIETGMSTGVWNVVDMQGNDRFIIECKGVFSMKRTLIDCLTGNVVAVMSKNPISLGKWAISMPDGRQLAQTKCVPGMAKFGLLGCVPSRDQKATVAMFPTYELNKIEFSALQTPGKITLENRYQFAMAQYGPNVVSALQAFMQDFSFILTVAPGADVALSLCCMAIYDDLAEWNATAPFAGF